MTPRGPNAPNADLLLVVDTANVLGSRPDGWWRDRVGATTSLLEAVARLSGALVRIPGEVNDRRLREVIMVLEGRAKRAEVPAGVIAVRAEADGDERIAEVAAELVARADTSVLVVTGDRGLRARLPADAVVVGATWLNHLIGRS